MACRQLFVCQIIPQTSPCFPPRHPSNKVSKMRAIIILHPKISFYRTSITSLIRRCEEGYEGCPLLKPLNYQRSRNTQIGWVYLCILQTRRRPSQSCASSHRSNQLEYRGEPYSMSPKGTNGRCSPKYNLLESILATVSFS